MKPFVLSASEFGSIKKAENKINSWYESGELKTPKTKLYKVVEVYDLRLKYVRRKK